MVPNVNPTDLFLSRILVTVPLTPLWVSVLQGSSPATVPPGTPSTRPGLGAESYLSSVLVGDTPDHCHTRPGRHPPEPRFPRCP